MKTRSSNQKQSSPSKVVLTKGKVSKMAGTSKKAIVSFEKKVEPKNKEISKKKVTGRKEITPKEEDKGGEEAGLDYATDLAVTQEPGWFGVSLHLELGFRGSAIGYKILQKEGKADVEVEENYRGRYECHNRMERSDIRQTRIPDKIYTKIVEYCKKYSYDTLRFCQVFIDQAFLDHYKANCSYAPEEIYFGNCLFDESLGKEKIAEFLLSTKVPYLHFAISDEIIQTVLDAHFLRKFIKDREGCEGECTLRVLRTRISAHWTPSDDLLPILARFDSLRIDSIMMEPKQLAKLIELRSTLNEADGYWSLSLTRKMTTDDFYTDDNKEVCLFQHLLFSNDVAGDLITMKAEDGTGSTCSLRIEEAFGEAHFIAKFDFDT